MSKNTRKDEYVEVFFMNEEYDSTGQQTNAGALPKNFYGRCFNIYFDTIPFGLEDYMTSVEGFYAEEPSEKHSPIVVGEGLRDGILYLLASKKYDKGKEITHHFAIPLSRVRYMHRLPDLPELKED